MPNAVGVHAHTDLKLGLRPPTPGKVRLRLGDYLTGKVRLRLGDYLTGKLPDYPPEADYLTGLSFGLYQNNRYGVCGPTALANYVRLVTARLTGTMAKPSQEAVFQLYRQSGNPNFDPATGADDNGVNLQVMLEAAARYGLDGHEILGFAQVDVDNLDEMDAAVGLFGGMIVGVGLDQAQQAQTDTGTWEYVPGSPDWGGHAVMDGGYLKAGGHRVITWAKPVMMTDRFILNQQFEAWVVILKEHLGSKQFVAGVDVQSLAGDYEALTGRKFPATVPPAPPAPPPPVTPPKDKPMTLQGYAQIPLLGKAPIVLQQTAAENLVGFSWPQVDVLALLEKYGKKYVPVVIRGLLEKKSWKDILTDVLTAIAADAVS